MKQDNEEPDWYNLVSVIQYVEKLGPGYTIFSLTGHQGFHICETKDFKEDTNEVVIVPHVVKHYHDTTVRVIGIDVYRPLFGKRLLRKVRYQTRQRG